MKLTSGAKHSIALSAAALFTMGCASVDVPALPDAVLLESDADIRRDIEAGIAQILARPSVTIAPDSLTKSSQMTVELAVPKRPDGRFMMGRRMDVPDRFTLKSKGNKCYLLHVKSGDSFALPSARCRAL